MKEPLFITVEEVIEIHTELIERYGGMNGIRDIGLLQSGMAMPQAEFSDRYLHSDLFEMVAAYLFHLVQNHPFVDRNTYRGNDHVHFSQAQ